VKKPTLADCHSGSKLIPPATDKEKVEPYFRLHRFKLTQSWRNRLEAELRRELEGARTTRAKHACGTGGWSVDYILNYAWRFTLLCEGDGRWVSKVSYVEDVEDFADKIELQPFAEAEGLR
jgi:hypothetical protein